MAIKEELQSRSASEDLNTFKIFISKTIYWQACLISLLFASILVINHGIFFNVNADPRLASQPWLLNNGFIQ